MIPQDALDRIAAIAPRSSLIVTDEGVSPETGKGTEFVVVLSGEPQGGIKKRRRNPGNEFRYARQRGHHYWLAFRKSLSTGEPPFFVRRSASITVRQCDILEQPAWSAHGAARAARASLSSFSSDVQYRRYSPGLLDDLRPAA